MIAVGVARPIAQGQAMTTTAMKAVRARVIRGSGPARNQIAKVSPATISTSGTKTSLIRSARRWIGALEPWARWTRSTIEARTVSRPTRVARITTVPEALSVAPISSSPADLLDRQRLARQHRLVDRGLALDDDPVDRDLLAGSNPQEIADADRRQRDVDLAAVLEPASRPGLEPDQAADRAARLVLGAGLEPAAEEDQADDDRRAVEVGLGLEPGLVDDVREERHEDAVGPGRARADGDQGVHVRRPVTRGAQWRRHRSGGRPRPG